MLALAQGFSGLVAVALAVLVFLAERTIRRRRARDPVYQRNLVLIIVTAAVTAILGALSLSSWAAVAPHNVYLLLGWDSRTWLALVFGAGIAGAVACIAVAALALNRFRREAHGSADWAP